MQGGSVVSRVRRVGCGMTNDSQGVCRCSTVISDASFCPDTGAAGWAYWVSMDGVVWKDAGFFIGVLRNPQEAEFLAALKGCSKAIEYGGCSVLMQMDCDAVVRAINDSDDSWFGKFSELFGGNICISASHINSKQINDEWGWAHNWCDKNSRNKMRKRRYEITKEKIPII